MTNKYDSFFISFGTLYDIPWKLAKAQGIVESNLNPNAQSSAGACGIMQIMPPTFENIKRKLKHLQSIWIPEDNIEARIYYDAVLRKVFSEYTENSKEEFALMLIGYNWGPGHLKRLIKRLAQRESTYLILYDYIPDETKNYVDKVIRMRLELEGKVI